MGLPFFAPMFDAQAEIVIHYPETADARSRPALEALFLPPYSPITLAGIKARLRFEPLLADEGRTLLEGGIEVAHAWCDAHPRSGVLIYRVRSGNRRVVYATDFESPAGFDDRLRDFAAGADLLIHDSQYVEADYFDNARPRAGFGHSTASMAARNAVACGAGRLFLFHYDPKYSDAMLDEMQAQARAEFPRTFLAREGKSIKIRR
jgi:ribonuclease BN (tRNA processing enzyme)